MSTLTLTNVRLVIRHGTAASWTAANPTLAEGEMGLELDTSKEKYGDGGTPWNSLPYANRMDTSDDLTEGSTNLYYTDARARAALSAGAGISYDSTTGVISSTGGTVTSVALTTPGVLYSVSGSPITSSGTLALSLIAQNANKVLAGPTTGADANPSFRALVSADIPALSYVTSVAMTVPSILSVSGTPITTSGTLAVTLATQTANTVFAGPTTGSAAGPTFRSLVATDIPSLSATYLPLAGGTLTGALLFSTDNTLDIGASGATRPRSVYVGTSFKAPDGTASAPTYAFSGESNYGFYHDSSAHNTYLSVGGSACFGFGAFGTINCLLLQSTYRLAWSSGDATGNLDLSIQREGAAILQMGGDSATPIAQMLKGPDARAGTDTNTVGGNLTIAAGRSTGTGLGGSLFLATSPAGSTGTAANALVNRVTIDSTGAVQIPGLVTIGSGSATADPFGSAFSIEGNTGTGNFDVFSAASGASGDAGMNIFSARGTIASPTAIQSGDRIAGMYMGGYGTSYNATASFEALANQTFTGSAKGTYILFKTTPDASTTRAERLRITAAGLIAIGGGGSSSFPALARSSTTLKCRLADDSADAPFTCGDFTIGGGTAVKKILSATAVLDFGNTLAQTDSDLTVTVTGAALGDVVILGVPNGSTQTGSCYSAWVSATDTVTVRFSVYGIAAKDPASGTFRVTVLQF